MTSSTVSNLTIQIAQSINEIDEQAWNELSAGRPFQSHRWYQFGERVMNDSQPTYLLVYQRGKLLGRAALWKIKNEPLPIGPGIGRSLLELILRCWPLLICRSPLANTTGLMLPPEPLRTDVVNALSEAALKVSRQAHCLALVFDFLSKEECGNWPAAFTPTSVSDPGTIMQSRWHTLDEYLSAGNKKDRQHYKRTMREAEKLGIRIERHSKVPDLNAAIELIHNVDRRYKNAPNPWTRTTLENLEMINGVWLEAKKNGKLVGCGALFEDNETQLTTALGLAENIPYVYLLLAYASLEDAFDKNVRALRWGSGAYDVKQNFGFLMEDNNNAMVITEHFLMDQLLRKFS